VADIQFPDDPSADSGLAGSVPGAKEDALIEQLRRTSELVTAQRLPDAELELLRAQAEAPQDLRVLKLLALVRFKLGRLAEARQIYREAVQVAPEDAAIRLNLGLIALKLDWFEEAVTELENAVHLRPDDRRAWSYLGYACARTGARAQAAAAFRRAGQHELAAEMERVASTAPAAVETEPEPTTSDPIRTPDSGPATPRPVIRTQVLDAVAEAPDTDAGGEIVDLSSFALTRMLVPEAESNAMAWLGQGVLRFTACDEAYLRESALLAAPGGIELTPAHRRIRGQSLEETLTSQGSRFLRLAGHGDLWLSPWSSGCVLFALSLDKDVLFLREENVVAWGDELVWEWGRVPGGGPALLQFRGTGRLVITAFPDDLVTVRLGEGDSFSILSQRLMGWVGRVVAQAVPGEGQTEHRYVTCSGVGVVLLSKYGNPARPDDKPAQPGHHDQGGDRSGRPVLHR
jgi:tetratricopeptide (TPR) repeat protein